MRAVALVLIAWTLGSCIDPPQLRGCAEFPAGTEGCPPPCEVYCGLLVDACPDQIPASDAPALDVCVAFCNETLSRAVEGTVGALSGNTLDCRMTHARLAAGDPAGHCRAAGPEGGETCVDDTCATYCAQARAHCDDLYPSDRACLDTCEAFPKGAPGTWDQGNSLACRTWYARLAVGDDTARFCEAASVTGGGLCGPPCDGYCDQLDAHCAENAVYPNRETCLETCGLMNTSGQSDDHVTEADTVECRAYHVSHPAKADPGLHCGHGRLYDQAHCGDVCDKYCALMARECPGTHTDASACRDYCESAAPGKVPLWPEPDAALGCVSP